MSDEVQFQFKYEEILTPLHSLSARCPLFQKPNNYSHTIPLLPPNNFKFKVASSLQEAFLNPYNMRITFINAAPKSIKSIKTKFFGQFFQQKLARPFPSSHKQKAKQSRSCKLRRSAQQSYFVERTGTSVL